jgi:hypothetical protein
MRLIMAMALGFCAASAHAAPAPILARAAVLQPPVWVERDGSRTALRPGAPLYAGDHYETGPGGRLHIETEDASTIKLGENAQFQLPVLAIVDDGSEGGLFRGALKVLKGAFRFTTSALGVLRKREVDVSIGPTITAGIRGTDIWGKSEDSQELLCLLEGKVQVSSPGQPEQTMDQPQTFYVVPRDQAPLPIQPTPEGKLAKWALQTEMDPSAAALQASGRFRVVLASFANEAQATHEAARLAQLGYAADVLSAQTRFRVVMTGFESKAEAARFAGALRGKLGLQQPWVMAPG